MIIRLKYILFLFILQSTFVVWGGNRHGTTSAHTTLNGKILTGYQGWFATPADGAGQSWKHYSISTQRLGQAFEPGACSIDMWPDMREYPANEQYATAFTNPDGSKATVFSSYNMNTSLLHFRWMEEYGIDGVILQRFVTNIRNSGSLRNFNDTVLVHTMKAAKQHNRAVALMYDMTSMRSADTTAVKNDWKRIVDSFKVTNNGDDQPYLFHKGKPLICLWGVGFNDGRHDTIASPTSAYSMHAIRQLVRFFKEDPQYGGCTVLLGVNYTWRSATNKVFIDDLLFDIIRMSDVVNPWLVGRLSSVNSMSSFGSQIQGDLFWCQNNQVEYMPCAFPGFSWINMAYRDATKSTTIISRDKGNFLWRQFETAVSKGVSQIYATMFDEIDEGTALFKVTNTPPNNINGNNEPNTTRVGDYPPSVFQTLDGLSSDYYLWMTGEATRMLRKEVAVTQSIPIRSDRFSLSGVSLVSDYVSEGLYRISYTGTLSGRLFASKPYVVAYGAPTYNKEIDDRYFGTELTSEEILVEGVPGQVVTVIRTDAERKALGASSVVLQPSTGIQPIQELPASLYYDKLNQQLVVQPVSGSSLTGTFEIVGIAGNSLSRFWVEMLQNQIKWPVVLPGGMYVLLFKSSGNSYSQKFLVIN